MAGGTEEEAANKLGNACPQRAPTNSTRHAALTAAVEMTTSSTGRSEQWRAEAAGNWETLPWGRKVCTVTRGDWSEAGKEQSTQSWKE